MSKKYKNSGVRVLIVNVMEEQATAKSWGGDRHKFTFPVLLDHDGKVAQKYAPADVLPDLPRHEVPIASNLIIDKQGVIRFYSLLDSQNFDAKLVQLTKKLDEMMKP